MAPMVSDSFIDDVRAANDIVEVVSAYVPLRQKGHRYWGLCPFHQEKTPSFSVDAQSQLYYCFGCHAGGNVFHFLQHVEHCEFAESLRILAERAHMAMPDERDGAPARREDKDALYQVGKLAAQYFHDQLAGPGGEEAHSYLARRGISDRTIRAFGLGYALDRWDGLYKHLQGAGVPDSVMERFGVIRMKDGRCYDTFRNRVMFPIIDHRGRVVGFGGRVLDKSLPKYVNSQESPVFNKRKMLYGLNMLKKISKIDRLMIVEGYMDLISLHQAGFPAVVATLGTALTPDQARLLRRYCPDVYISYDADTAGEQATWRGLEILDAAGLNVRVVTMPQGLDPDDFARAHGLAGIEGLLDSARPLHQYRMESLAVQFDLTRTDERTRYVSECCRLVLAPMTSPVERDAYIQRLSSQTGIGRVAIEEEMALVQRKKTTGDGHKTFAKRNNNANEVDSGAKERLTTRPGSQDAAESAAVLYGLTGEAEARRVLACLAPEEFQHPVLTQAARVMAEGLSKRRWVSLADVMTRMDENASAILSELAEGNQSLTRDEDYINDCLERLTMDKVRRRLNEIQKELKLAENDAQRQKLKQEFQHLSMNYKGVKHEYKREGGYDD